MAGKTTVTIKIEHANGGQKQLEPQRAVSVVQANRGGTAGIQKIGTGDTPINVGGVGVVGNFYFRNDDDAAIITVGVFPSVFYPVSTLQPGQHGTLPGGVGVVYYAKSTVPNGLLWVNIHEA